MSEQQQTPFPIPEHIERLRQALRNGQTEDLRAIGHAMSISVPMILGHLSQEELQSVRASAPELLAALELRLSHIEMTMCQLTPMREHMKVLVAHLRN
jgi:hypothetical protein